MVKLSKTLFVIFLGCSAARPSIPPIQLQAPDVQPISSEFSFNWPDASVVVPNDGEYSITLRQDARTPFAGLLLSPPAVARIVASARYDREICRVVAETQYNFLLARANRELALAGSAHQLTFDMAQIRIDRLNQELLIQSQTEHPSIWYYAGFGVAFILAGMVGFIVGTLAN